eukprot:349653-Chlamydomonas_euryale.AAC.5
MLKIFYVPECVGERRTPQHAPTDNPCPWGHAVVHTLWYVAASPVLSHSQTSSLTQSSLHGGKAPCVGRREASPLGRNGSWQPWAEKETGMVAVGEGDTALHAANKTCSMCCTITKMSFRSCCMLDMHAARDEPLPHGDRLDA